MQGRSTVVPVHLDLEIVDLPGAMCAADSNEHAGDLEEDDGFRPLVPQGADQSVGKLVDALASYDGIAYFFDSAREARQADALDYFQCALACLEQQAGGSSRLPHQVAVCIAKFDQPHTLDVARRGGYLSVNPADPYAFPRVADDQARNFFDELCAVYDHGSAALIRHALDRYFQPERVHFFATSSIGFFVDSSKRFRWDDHLNIDGSRLRSDIRPINVLEPLLWLQMA